MSDRFITYVIIGVAFGFTQLWFAYWVVKLYKEKQRLQRARRDAAGSTETQPVTTTGEPADPPARPVAGHVPIREPAGQPRPRTLPRKPSRPTVPDA